VSRATKTRRERVDATLRGRRQNRPLSDATPSEVAHLALLQAIDHAVVVGMLVTLVDERNWPARRRVSILREVQDCLVDDAKDGTTTRLDDLWNRLHPDPQRTTTEEPT
jgi:hypothetical protein